MRKVSDRYTLYVYIDIYDGQYCIYALFFIFFQMSVYLGVISPNALKQFFFLSFFLSFFHLYCKYQTQSLKWDATFDLLIVLSLLLFCVLFLLVLPFIVPYIHRINLNWDDKEKNKRLIRPICLCMLMNVFINIQLLDDIIFMF